jgi:ATP synthase protein I
MVGSSSTPPNQPPSAKDYRAWDDEEPVEPIRTLKRDEAQALMQRERAVSPWRVVAMQGGVGVVVAVLARLVTGTTDGFWSALYGAACVVVPGAVLARGLTSKLSSATPMLAAVTFMVWQSVKLAVSVAMLMLAAHFVPGLNWLALLAGLVVCIKVYWVALLWRDPSQDEAIAQAVAQSRRNTGIGLDIHGRR